MNGSSITNAPSSRNIQLCGAGPMWNLGNAAASDRRNPATSLKPAFAHRFASAWVSRRQVRLSQLDSSPAVPLLIAVFAAAAHALRDVIA